MPTFVPLGGDLAGCLVAGLIGNNIVDAFAVADANSQTGKLLRHLVGPAFDEFKSLADMDAVAASATAMDAVAASATAMNAVAASATAMDAVAASATARSIALRSSYANVIWDTPNSSYLFTVGGTTTGETSGKTSNFDIVAGRLTNGKAQKVAAAGPSNQSTAPKWSIVLDLTGVTKIGIYTQATAANNQYVFIAIELDGITLYSGNYQPSNWTYREFTVNKTGLCTLTLKGWNNIDSSVYGGIFTEIYLKSA